LPYLERVIPAMLLRGMAPGFVIGLVFLRHFVAAINFDIRAAFVSYLPMFGLGRCAWRCTWAGCSRWPFRPFFGTCKER